MKEKTLLIISLVIGIVGIIILYIISSGLTYSGNDNTSIQSVSDDLLSGVVLGVSQYNTTTFLRMEQCEIVSITVFGNTPDVKIGDFVQVRGREDSEDRVIADEIRVI
ncbi:hypothetical protein HQ545_01415 [Candidatus Woesearchaeota archaeon]|nr:hypothetical protein [Candidatus Woesearchaeota archaeon]